MSAYKTIATKMTRTDVLKAALENIKPKWKGHVQTAGRQEKGIPLYGYHGDDRSKKAKTDSNFAPPCEVMIPGSGSSKKGRGNNVVGGASNDIGFSRNADGTFGIHISDYDQGKYNGKWQNELAAEYGLMERVQDAVKIGAQIGERQTFNHPQWGQVTGVRVRVKKDLVT